MKFFYSLLHFFRIRTHRAFRLTIRAIALFAGLGCGFQMSKLMKLNQFDSALYWFAGVLAAAFIEFIVADVLADRSFPFDTERKLSLIEQRLGAKAIGTITERLKAIISTFKGCDTKRISATVHIITELSPTADDRFRKGLLQITDYVGPEGGRKGRITLTTQGIIGRCIRTGRMEVVDFASREEYYQSMIRRFGFSAEEASRHSATGRSYLALPLAKQEQVVGVVYFFTSEPQVFPHSLAKAQLDDLAREIINYLEMADLI